MRNRYLKRWFFASSAVCLGILLTGCQTTESMATRIPPPGTQLAGQEYYSPGSASAVTPSVDYTPNDRNTIQGTDSWSPRARQPMQIATEPEGRQISFSLTTILGPCREGKLKNQSGLLGASRRVEPEGGECFHPIGFFD